MRNSLLSSIVALASLAGCATPERNATSISAQEAKDCVVTLVRNIKLNPDAADEFISKRQLQTAIEDAFGVGPVFLFFNQASIWSAFENLQEMLANSNDLTITIDAIEYPDSYGKPYTVVGTAGDSLVELSTFFYGGGVCKLADVRYDGANLMSLFIGRLATEPGFQDKYELDPYADF